MTASQPRETLDSNETEATGTDTVTVTLWLRADAANAPDTAALRERVAALADDGVETTIHECPSHATDPGTAIETAAVNAFDHYRAVTGRCDISIDPFFRCWTNPDGSRTVVFPVACLAVEREGNLTGLYPHFDGERQSVEDGLDAIEAGDVGPLC